MKIGARIHVNILSSGEICVANFRPPWRLLLVGAIVFLNTYLHDFGQIRGLPISPELTNIKISQQFLIQNPNLKGDSFKEKNCQLLYLGSHTVGRFLLNGGSANLLALH